MHLVAPLGIYIGGEINGSSKVKLDSYNRIVINKFIDNQNTEVLWRWSDIIVNGGIRNGTLKRY